MGRGLTRTNEETHLIAPNAPGRYGRLTVALHWLMLILIVATYAMMDLNGLTQRGSPGRATMEMWHYMLGLSVFLFVWVRLLARLAGAEPPIEPPPPLWQDVLARLTHTALYLFMIAMPVLGWLTLSARAAPVPFFGLELPQLIAKNASDAKSLKYIHETIALLGYYLIGLHAAAALFHHYLVRDNTLRRMWFARRAG